ncbi:MAG: ferredoxin--NADP reductase [Acidimicrobiia bacterium]
MGQRIEVSAVPMGSVALFTTDRSLTGQDGVGFRPDSIDGAEPPAELARRLFQADSSINHVYVLSNTVSVRRGDDWDDESLGDATGVISGLFIHYSPTEGEVSDEGDEALRRQHYNATFTEIRAHNEDLWVLKVRPDEPINPFEAGQYTTLALGYWEPRADDAVEGFAGGQREKLARRSYSVSSSIVDENGNLVEPHPQDVEFYIVKVRPGEDEIPALTPRIFLKGVGDRIFMGRKFTGHYTLEGVKPTDNVIFLSTGTGEAPQNKMTAELLRREHTGHILNLVCVRFRGDLAYTEQQAIVERRYPNYRFVTLTTREPENEGKKVYIQGLITSGQLEAELGAPLDPATTHVYLCGNPSMIGLPKWADDDIVFPETVGVCQLLYERGFTIDQRKQRGNVHYEEYWKDR